MAKLQMIKRSTKERKQKSEFPYKLLQVTYVQPRDYRMY